jgi:hypothetical protein
MITPVKRAKELIDIIEQVDHRWSHGIAKQKKKRLLSLCGAIDRREDKSVWTNDNVKYMAARREISEINQTKEDLIHAYKNLVIKYKKFKKG